MADVLSQQEIDQLLSALDSGDLKVLEVDRSSEKKIKKYDFKRPNKFNKEQIRILHIIYENYSRLLSTFFSGMLRTYCHVEIVSVEEQIFYEFTNSITDPIILAITKMEPMPANTLLEVSTSITFGIIERLLGGTCTGIYEVREFTEIELTLMQKTLRQMVSLLKEAWSGIVDIEPSIERVETNSRLMQILPPSETIAIITMKVSLGNVDGVINVCIPHLSIKAVENQLNSQTLFASNKKEEERPIGSKEFIENIGDSEMKITAVLGSTYIAAGDVLELQKGDVIQLDAGITSNVKILVEDLLKFEGLPGIYGNKKAVKIIKEF